jgi:hypothetical protein
LSLNKESEYSLIHFCLLGKHRVPTIPPGIVSNCFQNSPSPPYLTGGTPSKAPIPPLASQRKFKKGKAHYKFSI